MICAVHGPLQFLGLLCFTLAELALGSLLQLGLYRRTPWNWSLVPLLLCTCWSYTAPELCGVSVHTKISQPHTDHEWKSLLFLVKEKCSLGCCFLFLTFKNLFFSSVLAVSKTEMFGNRKSRWMPPKCQNSAVCLLWQDVYGCPKLCTLFNLVWWTALTPSFTNCIFHWTSSSPKKLYLAFIRCLLCEEMQTPVGTSTPML